MKKLLVTTALEETWGDGDEHLVFLGEWCRSYNRKNVWSKRSHEVMPYHWQDREKFVKDYEYLEELYERVLISLSDELNKYHGLDKPILYWRTIAGRWLLTYLPILWDRWESLRLALEKYDYSEIIQLNVDKEKTIPVDYVEFTHFMNSHVWNYNLFENIIKHKGIVCHENKAVEKLYIQKYFKASSSSWKKRSLYFLDRWISYLPVKEKILFSNSYFNFKDFMALSIKLKQLPRWHTEFDQIIEKINNKSLNSALLNERNVELKFEHKNDFERFLSANILNQMPIVLLEGFHYMVECTHDIKTKASLIFSANSHLSNLFFQTWLAENIIKDKKLISSVHGGSMQEKYSMFSHDEKISYKKVVWHVPYDIKHIQLPPNKITKSNAQNYSGKILLMIGLEFPVYSYRMQSGPGSDLLLENIEMNIEFYSLLNDKPKNNYRMKPALSNLGWNTKQRYIDAFSKNNVTQEKSLKNEINRSRVIVCTYPQTTFSDAMHSGVATILLYPKKYWELEDVFEKLTKVMKDAKIIFSDAKEAANHINNIWDDPREWWNSPKVMLAKEMFFDMCGRTNPNWTDDWSAFFYNELKMLEKENHA